MDNNNRQDAIRAKGFNMGTTATTQYGKIKVGVKTIDDAILDLGSLKSGNKMIADKSVIMRAMAEKDLVKLREISDYFFHTSGIYEKTCKYFATMYRYDWYVVPEIYGENVKEDKVVKDFAKVLNYLDNSYIKKICGEIALKVIKDGAYYAYIAEGKDGLVLQDLPINYCRSRFSIGNQPAVEFKIL